MSLPASPAKLLWMGGVSGYLLSRNLAFKHAPQAANALMRLTNVSGRGRGRDGSAAVDYFRSVLADYEVVAETAGLVAPEKGAELWRGRRVLELGPGNTKTIALAARARGAEAFTGWDAFDVQSRDHAYLDAIYGPMLDALGVTGGAARAHELLAGVEVHADAGAIRTAAAGKKFDLVISRAVLEHVRDLDRSYRELDLLLSDDAVLIHKVDLRCHGFRWNHELDFLMFSERLWRGLTTHIGEPNRKRYPEYLELGERYGFVPVWAASTHVIPVADVERVRPSLAEPYRSMTDDALRTLGFWVVQVRRGHPLASRRATLPLAPAPHDRLGKY
jgi:SAM-dependent methyltransferase